MRWMIRGLGDVREASVERTESGFEVVMDGSRHQVDLVRLDGALASLRFAADGRSYHVSYQVADHRQWRVGVGEREFDLSVLTPVEAVEEEAAAGARGPSRVEAPIPGKVVAVNVAPGDQVEVGDALVVLEAMKMENELIAEQPGTVRQVHVTPGQTVAAGAALVELE